VTKIKPIICGVAGPILCNKEKDFIANINPAGFALFKKNLKNKKQVLALTNSLRDIFSDRVVPILIDQEGGKVLRLNQENWRQPPSPLELGQFAYLPENHSIERASRLVYLNALLIGYEMSEIGINVNCAPVADLLIPQAHNITSTRSFGPDPLITSHLVKEMSNGLLDAKVTPIIKHMLGQGRAKCDSHIELPVVTESLNMLENSDFQVFSQTNRTPWGMPAHIIYQALDPNNIVTYSKKTIDYIKNIVDFKGILISDCITMKALPESWAIKASKALNSGLDLVFYGGCLSEVIEEITSNIPCITDNNWKKIENSLQHNSIKNINFHLVKKEFDSLLLDLQDELQNCNKPSKDLKFILEIISARNENNADFSSPLYKA
jgi:beta-N-acetylhexosaminidase